MYIDAIGKACPIPVMLAKKELDKGCLDLVIAVDNQIAVENLTRLAENSGLSATVQEKEGGFEVQLQKTAQQEQHAKGDSHFEETKGEQSVPASEKVENRACNSVGCGYAVFIGKETVGDGERELGENLMKMAIYTLAQSDDIPASILFMNSGVKLPAGEEQQVIDSLKELIEKGTEVLVCGTCLNYYGLTEQLKVGTVSNMYDILGKMQSAAKVISL